MLLRVFIGFTPTFLLLLLPALFFAFPHPAVEPYRFFSGFGHPALVAICALMILGHALVLTGALEPAARRLAVLVEKSPRLALLLVLCIAAAASGVMNDTPVVVLLMPLLIAALRRAGRGPAFMLMPKNFAVLIGGTGTTIGTTTLATTALGLVNASIDNVSAALARMGTSRLDLRGIEHLSFAKLLGTAKPTTFTPTATAVLPLNSARATSGVPVSGKESPSHR